MNDPRNVLLEEFRKKLHRLEEDSDLLKFEIERLYIERAEEIRNDLLDELQERSRNFLSENPDVTESELRSAVRAVFGADSPAKFSRSREALTIFASRFGSDVFRNLIDEYRKSR